MRRLLEGVRVLDLSALLPGPYASLMLADLGAEIIKVESRLGDLLRQMPPMVRERSAFFLALNRGKRSLGLDLRRERGRALFLELAAASDVVIESFRPGRAERMGVGPDAVQAANPQIVYCSLSGYGQSGPDADRVGHDLTYLARSGVLGLNRRPGQRPVPPPVQMADLTAGTNAALAVCAALLASQRTGRGQVLDVSILDSMTAWMAPHIQAHLAGERAEAGALPLSGRYPFYDTYRTADGGFVALAALEPLFWRDFCRAVGRDDLRVLQFGDADERAHLTVELTDLFAARTRAEWRALFREHDLSAAVVADLDEVLEDPQLAARGVFIEADHPEEGALLGVDTAPRGTTDEDAPASAPAPDPGADTRTVLTELLDLSPEAVDNLIDEGVAFDPERAASRRVAPRELP